MASDKRLTTILLSLPIVTAACIQSPPSTDILRKQDSPPVEVSSLSENSSAQAGLEQAPATQKPYAKVARKHAAAYGLDWKLVIAVMETESSFRHNVVSRRGAYGLMQIMPHTRAEIRQKLGLREARSPYNNVKAGVYYLKKLSRNFASASDHDRLRLTLAAYNAGLTRIRDAQRIAAYFGESKDSWESVRAALPILSSRYASLHRRVWDSGKPRGGYFKNSGETVSYVESVIAAYDDFMLTSMPDNSL